MGAMIKTKIRTIGTSAGVLLPKETLKAEGITIGDEVMIAIIKKKKDLSGFGIAKNATKPFQRDKKLRKFL